MAKTAKQIQGDIYQLLKDSTLYSMISGEVYRKGYRPPNSQMEDAVVIFTAGLADQIQTGFVTIQLFIPDIDPWNNGLLVEDGNRTEEMETIAQQWCDSLSCEISNYKFKQSQTIMTDADDEIHQHFVVIKLRYEYYGDDYAPLNIPQWAAIDATDTDEDDGYLPLLVTEDDDVLIMMPPKKNRILI